LKPERFQLLSAKALDMADTVYLGDYDNTVNFVFKISSSPISLTDVTMIESVISGISVTSTNQVTDLIQWDQAGYQTGEIRCKFGAVSMLYPGTHKCTFVLYNPTYVNGLVFEPIDIIVKQLYVNF
jgi:hypothetical protein